MYLSKGRIMMSYLISIALLLISGFFLFIGVVGIFMYSSQLEGARNEYMLQELKESMGVCIGMIVFFTPLLVIGLLKIKLVNKSFKFNTFFEGDPNGCLSVENTARLFGMPIHKFVELFDKLVKKGFLVNCSLENPDNPVIV